MTPDRVVIDKDILGWAEENNEKLASQYQHIVRVSSILDLPQRSPDAMIGSYCKDNSADFLTADKTAYTHFFRVEGLECVQIAYYAWWDTGDKPVCLVRIVPYSKPNSRSELYF